MRYTGLFSRRCCGGPVLILAAVCGLIGGLFVALSATPPGVVFLATGASSLTLCMLLGRKRCRSRGLVAKRALFKS